MTPIEHYLLTLLGVSLVAVGGASAVLPELHRVVVDQHHWMTSDTFAQLFAIAQAAPGPNVLVVALLGWKLAGVGGALASTCAMTGPSSIVAFAASRAWTRFEHAPARIVLAAVLAPVAVGLVAGSGIVIARSVGPSLTGLVLVAATVILAWRTRTSPLIVLLAGAIAGIAGIAR